MGIRASAGFTIIESILFLGLTGVLIGGMMFATSMTLGTQRYTDATESFKALLQDQYANITSVQNARENNLACTSQASPVTGGVLRGQSSCVIVGQYMMIDGGVISVYPVLAHEITGATATTDDIAAFRNNYRLNLAKQNVRELELEWDARIAWATAGNADDRRGSFPAQRAIALLFLRSPTSGQVYTFSSNVIPTAGQLASTATAPSFLRNMIQPGAVVPGQGARTICLDSGGLTSVPRTSIFISAYASGQSAVEVRSNDMASSKGAAERC